MPFDIYDCRTDIRNVVITPEIRARFMLFEPGAVGSRHSHDLGHEVFIVMQGKGEFEIEGERTVLGPRQMCFVWANQKHQVRTVGEEPMILYLSVTPHLEPTHTRYDEEGNVLPPSYFTHIPPAEREAERPSSTQAESQADSHLQATQALAEAATANARTQEAAVAEFKRAVADGDRDAAKAAIDSMWGQIYPLYKSFQAMELAWNDLTGQFME